MIDFATLQALSIPEGVVTQIADAEGRVLWAVQSESGTVVLEVNKITSNTYAGETTYTGEVFILLDIYPKTNGTVSVTYGGLTKTVTDTSGASEPNAQKVFFGTFNGVSDSVETPASGTVTIEGDCYGFGAGHYAQDNSYKKDVTCNCITEIKDFGKTTTIPASAFSGCSAITGTVAVSNGITSIGEKAFVKCTGINKMTIPPSVKSIPWNTWWSGTDPVTWNGTFLSIDESNPYYSFVGSCLIEKENNKLTFGFSDAVIPQNVATIGAKAFYYRQGMSADFVIPNGVSVIETDAFRMSDGIVNLTISGSVSTIYDEVFLGIDTLKTVVMLATTPPTVPDTAYVYFDMFSDESLVSITVPKGCGETYKSHSLWRKYADYIVEAS